MSRAETLFNSVEHEFACPFCNESLASDSDAIKVHLEKCEIPESLKRTVARYFKYHIDWKKNYSEIVKMHNLIDNGNNPFEDGHCVCDIKKDRHRRGGCGREKLYRNAAFPLYNLLTNNFGSYADEKANIEIKKMKLEMAEKRRSMEDLNRRKSIELRQNKKLAEERKLLDLSKIDQQERFNSAVQQMRDYHLDVHVYFDNGIAKMKAIKNSKTVK